MNYLSVTNEKTAEIRQYLDELIGNVTAKHLFTGYGFFHKRKVMFGLLQSSVFYLRAEEDLALTLRNLGAVPFGQLEPNACFSISHYYKLPDYVMKDKEMLRKLLILSIHQILEKKRLENLAKKLRIKELANLTIKHERMLKRINILDVESLRQVSEEEVMVRLKKRGETATLEFYWKLIAALKNINVFLLTKKEKEQRLVKLNEALALNGFRRYKMPND
ncbi:TfoX/Sxy family DNA transformation protein [Rodentibacter caecimuris]|uniref:DNA transformation protein n=1 Tax=Rodentibacter caecimuris TaxID=1796644 RepID=A0ABX3KXU4_9PAST|nr:hypothetical protein BKG89_10550 [Rodentibacter heylii]